MKTIRDEIEEYAALVADWLERIGVKAEITCNPVHRESIFYNDQYYDVLFVHASTPAALRLSTLSVSDRCPTDDEIVYHAMEWIADTLNSADQPDYEHFRSSFGFEDDDFARSYWRVAVEGRTFFDAILGENMHQEVHCLTALAGGVDDDTLEYTLNFLKGEKGKDNDD